MEHPFSVGARVRKLGCLSLHQQAADEVGCDDFGGAGEEGLGEVLGERGWSWWLWEWLGEEWVEAIGGENQSPTERRYAPPALNSRRLAQSLE